MKSLRIAFLILVLMVPVVMVVDHWREHLHDGDTYLEELEHRLACADWVTHRDSVLGYEMRYPSCFMPAEAEGEGSVRFAYVEQLPLRNVVYITLETTTEVCSDTLNPYAEMRKRAEKMGGVCLRRSNGEYLLTTRLQSRDPQADAYRMHAKYVLHQRLWFVETLIYPVDFAPAMHRLVDEVYDWRPYH